MSQDAAQGLQETADLTLQHGEAADATSKYAPTLVSPNQAVIARVRTGSKGLKTKRVSRKSRVSESASQMGKDDVQVGETGAQPRARKSSALKDALADINRLNMELVGLRLRQEQLDLTEVNRSAALSDLKKSLDTERRRALGTAQALEAATTATNRLSDHLSCQICLDILNDPWCIAPCGHMGCFKCLYNWFLSRPPADGTTSFPDPHTFRTKTCPQCRASVRVSPIPSFVLRNLVGEMRSSGLLEPTSPVVSNSTSRAGLSDGTHALTEAGVVSDVGSEGEDEDERNSAVAFSDSDSSVDDTGLQARREHSNHLMEWELDFRNDQAGSWVPPRWETPRFTVDGSALSTADVAGIGLPQREIHALLRRGASKEMIRLYQMRFQRDHGITANSGSVSVQLGWNLARNATDIDGSSFMQAVMDEMRTHRERYSTSRGGRMGSATIVRLVPRL